MSKSTGRRASSDFGNQNIADQSLLSLSREPEFQDTQTSAQHDVGGEVRPSRQETKSTMHRISLLDFLNAQAEYRGVQLHYVNLVDYLTAVAQSNLAVERAVVP